MQTPSPSFRLGLNISFSIKLGLTQVSHQSIRQNYSHQLPLFMQQQPSGWRYHGTWRGRWQLAYPSGDLQTCAFPVFPALLTLIPGKADRVTSCQRWSFPRWNDGSVAWIFLGGSARQHSPPFSPPPQSVPFIFSVQRDLSATLPASHQPWRKMWSFFSLEPCDFHSAALQQYMMIFGR